MHVAEARRPHRQGGGEEHAVVGLGAEPPEPAGHVHIRRAQHGLRRTVREAYARRTIDHQNAKLRHIERIFEVCHFLGGEKTQFMQAYRRAHPHRAPGHAGEVRWRELALRVPDLRDREKNRELDELMKEVLQRVLRLMEEK